MLTLVWAMKYFHSYLYGKQFLVRTDHAAFSYLRNFADCSSRLMRWILRLYEFDFVIEHKAGTKICHVDAFSRHVGAIMENSLPDKERFLGEQKKESFCSSRKSGKPSSKSEYFLDEDGVLYKREPIINSSW